MKFWENFDKFCNVINLKNMIKFNKLLYLIINIRNSYKSQINIEYL